MATKVHNLKTSSWEKDLPKLYRLLGYEELTHRQICNVLTSYYLSNSLYSDIQDFLEDENLWTEGLKPLRNPVSRAIEFHVTHLWSGSLEQSFPIDTENTAIQEPLERVWNWSNWQTRKQLAVRWGALYGDLFIKVVNDEDKVYFQLINPTDTMEVDHDDRGNLTFIRIDTPYEDITEDGRVINRWQIEVWDDIGVRVWDLEERDYRTKLEELPNPDNITDYEELGFDFIPIVHGKALDLGFDWGLPVIWTSLDKIDELNRIVSSLHTRLFRYNKPTMAVESSRPQDALGKAVPPPIFVTRKGEQKDKSGIIKIGNDELILLPAGTQLTQVVPDLRYGDILEVVKDQMREIRQDLPELKYGVLDERTGELSGRAIRLMLSDAADRVRKMRNTFEAALIRANQIALSLGTLEGLEGFTEESIGNFDNGDFNHSFLDRDVLPLSEKEKADITKIRVDSEIPLEIALRWEGRSEAEIQEVLAAVEDQQRRQQQNLAQAVLEAQRNTEREGIVGTENEVTE